MNNKSFNQNGILSPIHVPRKNLSGHLHKNNSPSPRREVSFLSSTRLSPLSVPRYSLSENNSPKLTNEVHGNGPLLASTRFNVNLRTYTDAKSPGLASRIVQYDEEQRVAKTPTHLAKYDRPGLFPVVHFFKKDLPVIKPKKTKVTIKLAPADLNLYGSNLPYDESTTNIFRNKTEPDMGTRSVLDALKEISHKRIHSNEDYGGGQDSGKISKLQNLGNNYSKRMREESPPRCDLSPPSKPIIKKMCVIDPVYASNTSSLLYMQNGKGKATKTQATDDELLLHRPSKKSKNAETQTFEKVNVNQDIILKKPVEEDLIPSKERSQQRPLFNETIYEIRKKNKLALILGAITGEKPAIIPVLPIDKHDDNEKVDDKKLSSILSHDNKDKSKSIKHVSFNISDKKINEFEESKLENNFKENDSFKEVNVSNTEPKEGLNTSFEDDNKFSSSVSNRTSLGNFGGSITTSTNIYSAPVSSATIFNPGQVEYALRKRESICKTPELSINLGSTNHKTILTEGESGATFNENKVSSPVEEISSIGGKVSNEATASSPFGALNIANISSQENLFVDKNNTNTIKKSSLNTISSTSENSSSFFANLITSNAGTSSPSNNLGAVNSDLKFEKPCNEKPFSTALIKNTEVSSLGNESKITSLGTSVTTTSVPPTFLYNTTTKSSSMSFGITPTTTTFINNNRVSFGNSSKQSFASNTTNGVNTTPSFAAGKTVTPFGVAAATMTPSFETTSMTPSFKSTSVTPAFGTTTTVTTTTFSFGTSNNSSLFKTSLPTAPVLNSEPNSSTSTGFVFGQNTSPTFGTSFGNTTTASEFTTSFPTFRNEAAAAQSKSPGPSFGNVGAVSFVSASTTPSFANFGSTSNTTITPNFIAPKSGGFAFPAPTTTQTTFGSTPTTTVAFGGANKAFGSIMTTNNFVITNNTNTTTVSETFQNNTATKPFGNTINGTNTFGKSHESTFRNTGTNIFGGSSFTNNNENVFTNTSTVAAAAAFGSSPAFGSNVTVASSIFGVTTSAPVFSFGSNANFAPSKMHTTTVSFPFNSSSALNSTAPSCFGNQQTFPFIASTTTTTNPASTFPTFGAPNNTFTAGSNSNNSAVSFNTRSTSQQGGGGGGVFSFGSSNTPAKPGVFSFGAAETPKPSFGFPETPTMNQQNNSPNFNPGSGGPFNPQFNSPSPGMFNMGTGSSTRPRTQLRAKRRT